MQKINLPFPMVQLTLENNPDKITIPILDKDILWVNLPAPMMAGKFGDRYQEQVLDHGDYQSLLDYTLQGDFEKHTTCVEFKAGRQEFSFKKLKLHFDYFVQSSEQGHWAIIPALGVETFTAQLEQLEDSVQEVVQLDFMRKNRLNILQKVIATIWFEESSLHTASIDLRAYTPSELTRLQEAQQKEWLPKVAKKIKTTRQVLYGYQEQLERLADLMQGRYNRSVLLVGRSGVGKSTLVWELERQRRRFGLQAEIWETTASTLIKELTTGSIGWQENIVQLCKELTQKGDFLFVRNLLELFEVGQYQGNNVSMADFLRDPIAQGEVAILAECTDEEYARIEARSPNYLNNFQVLNIQAPADKAALENIILQKVLAIAQSEYLQIELEAIRETIRLNQRYTPYSGFPGKPIRFLESILMSLKGQHADKEKKAMVQLNRSAVIEAFCEETGMPPFMVDPSVAMDLSTVRAFFTQKIFGQNHAVDVLVDILASVKTALLRQGKPIASMLFVGPTGVGKTEMAKVLAQFMFGNRSRMVRFDMSEFSTPYAVSRLTGESYFSDGLLTSAVRKEPFCVLLFDELEKAHPSFNDLLLQILGEGRLTDSQGQLVNFCSAIIIMTSNIGAKKLQRNEIAWVVDNSTAKEAAHYTNEVRRYFRPEIFNRIDQVVPFYSLDANVVRFVVERELEGLRKREGLLHRNIEFQFSETLYDYLGEQGYNPKYGARALQRALREQLTIPLAQLLNQYSFDEKLVVQVEVGAAGIELNVEADPLKLDLLLEELTHNEYMDYATSLRQNIAHLFEGSYYVHLLSDLDLYKRLKKKNNAKFWASEEKSTRYTTLLQLQAQFESHRHAAEENEKTMALISMGLEQLNTSLYQQIEAWEKLYLTLKIRLYECMTPPEQTKGIYLGIYNANPRPLLQIYRNILERKNYTYSIRSVWYREALYNQLEETVDAEGNTTKEALKAYFKQALDFNNKNPWKADKKGDILLGVEIYIAGTAPNLYFNEEDGWQHIVNKDNKEKYFISTGEYDEITPQELHRKAFFQKRKKPRRVFSPNHLEDTTLNAPKRELDTNEQLDYLIELLDKRFMQKLDEVLL
jgi:ATP-dependent Clp protease ATP-binding subunit ClpA